VRRIEDVAAVDDPDEDSEGAAVSDPFVAVTTTEQETFKTMLAKEVEAKKNRPLMTQSSLLRLLAELAKSYSVVAKIITDYSFHAGQSDLITDDCSALAFILDNLLPSSQTIGDKDCPALSRVLISALSSCNHCPEAQTTLVSEVKSSLMRSLMLIESSEKHTRIQALSNVMYNMIESCPPSVPAPAPQSVRNQNASLNNIVKIMLRKGVVNDLARVTHSLDLSSPHMSGTINSVMKPLELLSRIVNTPSSVPPAIPPPSGTPNRMVSSVRRDLRHLSARNAPSAGAVILPEHRRTAMENDEGTERTVTVNLGETIGNAINRAIVATLDRGRDDGTSSSAVVPPLNPNGTTDDGNNQNNNRSNENSSEVTNNNPTTDPTSASDTHAMDDMTDNENGVDDAIAFDLPNSNSVVEMIRNELDAMDAQLNETAHEESHEDTGVQNIANGNETSDQDDDDDEDDDDEDDDDDDGEDDDDSDASSVHEAEGDDHEDDNDDEDQDDDEDDEEGSAMMDEEGMDAAEARIMVGIERSIEEDILLDIDEIISPAFRDLASGLIPMMEHESVIASGSAVDPAQPSIPQNPGTVSVSHPLLIRHSDVGSTTVGISSAHAGVPGSSSILASTRHGSRIPRSRFGRYAVAARDGHFWHHTTQALPQRSAPAGAILHTLLGTHPRDMFATTVSGANPRLVLSGNDFQIFAADDLANEHYLDFGDNGYVGQSSNNPMGNIPSAMLRWTEESRVLDGDSMHDCVACLRPEIIEVWEKYRDEEINDRKEKRRKMIEEDEKKNKDKKSEQKVENGSNSGQVGSTTEGSSSPSATEQLAANLVQSVLNETLGTSSIEQPVSSNDQAETNAAAVESNVVTTTSPASPSNDPVLPMESGGSSIGEGRSNASSHDSDMICNESAPSDHSAEGMEVGSGVSPPSLRTPEPVIHEPTVDDASGIEVPIISPEVSLDAAANADSPSTLMFHEHDLSDDDDEEDLRQEARIIDQIIARREQEDAEEDHVIEFGEVDDEAVDDDLSHRPNPSETAGPEPPNMESADTSAAPSTTTTTPGKILHTFWPFSPYFEQVSFL
jgi:E3 ubiquitin-protein ligase HUWE1